MSASIAPPMFLQFMDPNNSGSPLVGGKLFIYNAGTSTKATTWTDITQGTPNANPIILDANGACYVWLDPTKLYKFVLAPKNDTDPPSSAYRTVDNLSSSITLTTLTASLLGLILYPQTTAEFVAGVTPTNFAYKELDVQRYGATEGADISTAITTAISVSDQRGGGTIEINLKSWKASVTITSTVGNIIFKGLNRGTVTNSTVGSSSIDASPVFTIGDATHQVADITFEKITFDNVAGNTNNCGIFLQNARNVHFNSCTIKRFNVYQLKMTSIAAFGTAYIYLNDSNLIARAIAGSQCLIMDYGASFTTAVFLSNTSIDGTSAGTGGYAVDLNDQCVLRMAGGWMTLFDQNGIRLNGATSYIIGSGVMVDSNSSTDILVETDTNSSVANKLRGSITVDGLMKMPSGNTVALTGRNFLPDQSLLLNPHIVSALSFEDPNLSNNLQVTTGSTPQKIVRSTANLDVYSDGQVRNFTPTLVLMNYTGSADGQVALGITGIKWLSGSGSPEGAVTAPVGSWYSRSNGGAGTSFYVKESGSGNVGWVGK